MATRENYRDNLKNKLLALEDSSYGDFEYSNAELDTYLDLSVARMFPAVYNRNSAVDLVPTGYGNNRLGYVQSTDVPYDRVYLVEDAEELQAITGWEARADRIVGVSKDLFPTVNLHWTEAYTLPAADDEEAGIPALYEPLINLGALIEALEARQDTGVRGEPQPTGPFFWTQLIDRLRPRYDALKAELGMSLPGVRL